MSTVISQMSFLEPWEGKRDAPYVRGKVEESFPRTNFVNREYAVKVQNARPKKNEFDLDVHGFAFHENEPLSEHVIRAIRSRDKSLVEREYYPLAEEYVKRVTGASKVIIFDHTYRKRDLSLAPDENPNGREQPATVVSLHTHVEDAAFILTSGICNRYIVISMIESVVQPFSYFSHSSSCSSCSAEALWVRSNEFDATVGMTPKPCCKDEHRFSSAFPFLFSFCV